MTKITVFGQEEEKKLKPIEFVYFFDDYGVKHAVDIQPQWENATLLTCGKYDFIFAWDDYPQDDGCVYLGHWNDGVVD